MRSFLIMKVNELESCNSLPNKECFNQVQESITKTFHKQLYKTDLSP